MTWRREDVIGKGAGASKARGPRVPAAPVEAPQELLDADGEPIQSVFQAMGVGTGQGIWGTEHERYPVEVERQLMMECGIYPERSWTLLRRMMYRDIEAV